MADGMAVAGLFAGIGGVEQGLQSAGHHADLLCEIWAPAREVLTLQFPEVSLHDDVTTLKSLPKVDLLTAGFPCTDLSQAGLMAGINGNASGLVGEVFRLLDQRSKPNWVLIENVRNMLVLDQGKAMSLITSELEARGYRWAYRLVDSRFTGVPQRRQRVILLASRVGDPRQVLHADEAGEPALTRYRSDAFGFYWTEGLRGLGWAQDAVPTLKGGSTIGIPSAPGVWVPDLDVGRRLLRPTIEDAEAMQGLARGWTSGVSGSRSEGARWKLVGNAVTVGVARWVGQRLLNPGDPVAHGRALDSGERWPVAAYGGSGQRFSVDLSLYPQTLPYEHLLDVVSLDNAPPVSYRGAAGFLERLNRGNLKVSEDFRLDVKRHVEHWATAS